MKLGKCKNCKKSQSAVYCQDHKIGLCNKCRGQHFHQSGNYNYEVKKASHLKKPQKPELDPSDLDPEDTDKIR